jgi:tetratricopeptide (TPR) repeat protein
MKQGISLLLAFGVLVTASGCDALKERFALKKGNEFYTQQKYDKAAEEYAKILAIDPDSWDGNYLSAISYLAMYHPGSTHPKDKEYASKAIAAFEKCLSIGAPSDEIAAKVEDFYLSLLVSTGETEKASKFLVTKLDKDPKNPTLMLQLAQLYAKSGDFENAVKYFEMRAEAEPQSKEAWYTVGVVCWERSYKGGAMVSNEERAQVLEKGTAALERALSIEPEYFDALSYINLIYREKAKMLAELGDLEAAQVAYQTAERYTKQALEVRDKKAASPQPATGS